MKQFGGIEQKGLKEVIQKRLKEILSKYNSNESICSMF
jgi:hypothetical protein